MNQKYISSNSEKSLFHQNKISFKQTIKKIQFELSKQDNQRRRQISVKNRLRDLWLQRIKIVPPYLNAVEKDNFFKTANYVNAKESDHFKLFRHNCFKKDFDDDDIELLFQKRTLEVSTPKNQKSHEKMDGRKSCKSRLESSKSLVQILKSKKLRQNWKLAYRRDQLNILKFAISSPKESNFVKSPQKSQEIGSLEPYSEGQQKVSKFIYKKMAQQIEDQEKQNIQDNLRVRKNETNFRSKLKKGKTSIILRKPIQL